MNRAARRKQRHDQLKIVRELPDALTPIPKEDYPPFMRHAKNPPVQCWLSKKYLVQLYAEKGGAMRLSVSRSRVKSGGGWQENITWEELQQIKREVGFGDYYAVEVYPRDVDIVNVANIRHLWVLEQPLPFIGWIKE